MKKKYFIPVIILTIILVLFFNWFLGKNPLPEISNIKKINYQIYENTLDIKTLSRKTISGELPKDKWSQFYNLFNNARWKHLNIPYRAKAYFDIFLNNGDKIELCIWDTMSSPRGLKERVVFSIYRDGNYSVGSGEKFHDFFKQIINDSSPVGEHRVPGEGKD